jgi:hypothetical protein
MHTLRRLIAITTLAQITMLPLHAQVGEGSAASPVPLTREGHHHLVFSNAFVRAFYVELPRGDHTLVHQHDVDYLWVGLGAAKVINASVNKPQVHLESRDAALHFTRGGFAHAAFNEGETIYRNVTIELLQDQGQAHNLCEAVLTEDATDCHPIVTSLVREASGVQISPRFETDQIRFEILTIDQGGQTTLRGSHTPPVIVALNETAAALASQLTGNETGNQGAELRDGNVMSPAPNSTATLRNTGNTDARFLVLEFK